MRKISAGRFKAQCLAIIDEVQKTKACVLITKNGRPLAKLVPVEEAPRKFLGHLEGIMKVVGDIESPIWYSSRSKRKTILK
jgi:prevent-host-death family protein